MSWQWELDTSSSHFMVARKDRARERMPLLDTLFLPPLLFHPGPQPIRWCHSDSGRMSPFCSSYLSNHCDKISDQSSLREEIFTLNSQSRETSHHCSKEAMASGLTQGNGSAELLLSHIGGSGGRDQMRAQLYPSRPTLGNSCCQGSPMCHSIYDLSKLCH